MGNLCNNTYRKKIAVPGVKRLKYLFYPALFLHKMAWNLILLSAASTLRLSAQHVD
jgi:hypothetical protein